MARARSRCCTSSDEKGSKRQGREEWSHGHDADGEAGSFLSVFFFASSRKQGPSALVKAK